MDGCIYVCILPEGINFYPPIVELLGLWSPSSLQVLNLLQEEQQFAVITTTVRMFPTSTNNFQQSSGNIMPN